MDADILCNNNISPMDPFNWTSKTSAEIDGTTTAVLRYATDNKEIPEYAFLLATLLEKCHGL
eukprot:15102019-Ditylum_brightwellii.AAC.1